MPRSTSSTTRALTLVLLLVGPLPALAEPSIVWIQNYLVTDLSADGHVATGHVQNTLDVFRWTAAGGVENIGGSTAFLGIGGGEPKLDRDGSHITATIMTADSLQTTQGLWSHDLGWQPIMPPSPPGGIAVDNRIASSWGISGDGKTVVGLSWYPPARARASAWTEAGGPVDLGSQGTDSRANAVNEDGTVIVGWSSDPTTGAWQPTVWEDGAMTVLDSTQGTGEAYHVTPDGQMIAGQGLDTDGQRSVAVLYIRDGAEPTGWSKVPLGFLPGTSGVDGRSMATDADQEATIVLGINFFSTFSAVPFVWTPTYGMMMASDYLDLLGVEIPSTFQIQRLSSVSNDGRYLAGYGQDLYNPGATVSFIVDRGGVSDVPVASPMAGMELEPNHPNPFNPSTTLAVNLEQDGRISLVVHDTRGRVVKRIHDGNLPAGRHTWTWNGKNDRGREVASGVYLAVIRDGSGLMKSRRMALVK